MKNRIILITNAFPFGKGEASFVLPELEVLKDNYDITIISRNANDEQTTNLDYPIDVFRYNSCISIKALLPCITVVFNKDVIKEFFHYIKNPRKAFQVIKFALRAKHIARYIDDVRSQYNQPVVFYTYWNDYATYGLARFRKNKQDKVISRIHGGDLYLRPTNNYCLPLKRYISQNIDRLIFISEEGKNYFTKTYKPANTDNLVVHRMGVNNTVGLSKPSDDGVLRILSLSNITFGKRIDRIVEALAKIDDLKIEWTHIGDGEEEAQVVELAHRLLDTKDNIKYNFLGRLPNSKVKEFLLMQPIDLLLNVSYSEGLPVSMMEAASFGITIIGTNVGGVGEIINEANGFLLDRDFTDKDLQDVLYSFAAYTEEQKNALRQGSRKIWENSFDADINYAEFVMEVNLLWER